ncbi:MAG: hypothetical protein AYL29_010580 [Candidatus Bathyarchaeota archaeon B24]|nr:MAG: hypothetical protein AYL29_010580 [Candidatus Bathyarchaeota archaeon B24]MCD6445065.1 hypothetical protein [Candidatus Bathyarchaeota archaeon]
MSETCKVRVYAELNPTEDRSKVEKAMHSIVPSAEIRLVEEPGFRYLIGEAEGLDALKRLKAMLEARRIRDAARAVLLRWMESNRVVMYFNKQAAYMGRISFSEPSGESPLGPIRVEVETENPRSVIDWLTSKSGST